MRAGVVDDRRVRRDQHEVVGLGLAGYVGEIVVTQGVLLSVRPVSGDVVSSVLLVNGAGRALKPGHMIVARVGRGGVGRVRERDAVGAGETPEVVVEGVVLFDNDDNVLNWAWRRHALLLSTVVIYISSW